MKHMKAVEADIPIIIYDGYWNAGEENAVATVTWDQHATGVVGEVSSIISKKRSG